MSDAIKINFLVFGKTQSERPTTIPTHAIRGKRRSQPKLQVKDVARDNPPLSPRISKDTLQAENAMTGNEITVARL